MFWPHVIEVEYDYPPTMEILENDDNNSIYVFFNYLILVSNFYHFLFTGVHIDYD